MLKSTFGKLALVFLLSTISLTVFSQNYSLSFDGNDLEADHVMVNTFSHGTSEMTIEAWVKVDALKAGYMTITDFDGDNPYFGFNGNDLVIYMNVGSIVARHDFVPYVGSWTHVAVTILNGSQRLYINGAEVSYTPNSVAAVGPGTTTFSGSATSFGIGRFTGSDPSFDGLMDEVRIWDDIRTPTELTANMNNDLVGNESGLIAYYNFNEGTGTTLGDLAGTPEPGTFLNGATNAPAADGTTAGPIWTTDAAPLINNALTFDGVDDYVDMGIGIRSDLTGTSNVTVEAWIYRTATKTFHTIFSNYNSQLQTLLRLDTGQPTFWVNNGSFQVATGASTVPLNTWTHVAGSWDGSTISVYLNGVLDGSSSAAGTLVSNGGNYRIGGEVNNEWFQGQIDEVRVWNTTRTDSEILTYKDEEIDPASPGLLAYYRMNDGSGTTLTDLGANGYNGTFGAGGSAPVWNTTGPALSGATPLPPEPLTAFSPTAVSTVGFTANWQAEPSALSVFVDIDDNADFSSPILMDQPLAVPTGSSESISASLLEGTVYYYRLSYDDGASLSSESNLVSFMVQPGNAMSFDGVDDQVDAANDPIIDNISIGTVEAWVKTTDDSPGFKGIVTNDPAYGLYMDGGILVTWDAVAVETSGTFIADGNWHHVALAYTHNAGSAISQFYVDGAPAGSAFAHNGFTGSTGTLNIGHNNTVQDFTGEIDEVRIWNVSRNASEILNNAFTSLDVQNEPSLVFYLNFDQVPGSIPEDISGGGAIVSKSGDTDFVSSQALQLPCDDPIITELVTDNTSCSVPNGALTVIPSSGVIEPIGNYTVSIYLTSDVTMTPIASGSNVDNVTGLTATDLVPDVYTAEVTNNDTGCSTALPFTVSDNTSLPTIDAGSVIITFESTVGATDGVLDATGTGQGGSGSYTYNWYADGGLTIPIASTPAISALSVGTYYLEVVDNATSCVSAASSFDVIVAPQNALDFDGANDVVNLGDNIEGLASVTFEAWVYYVGNGGFDEICTKQFVNSFAINNGTEKLWLHIGNGSNWFASGGVSSTASIPKNVWTHVAASWDGSEVKMYINGMLDSTTPHVGTMGSNAIERGIGDYPNGPINPFLGQIDDLRIWNTVRTETEILGNLTTVIGSDPGLISYFDFNNSGNTSLTDQAGTNNGTLINFTLSGGTSNWVASTIPPCAPNGKFIGTTNSDWNDPSNWCGGIVPTPSNVTEDVVVSIDSDIIETEDLILNANDFQVAEGTNLLLDLSSNALQLTNGATFTNNGTVFFETGTNVTDVAENFINNGTIKGFFTFDNNFTNPTQGTVAPGASPGCANFAADFTNSGILDIEVDGLTPCSEHDQIIVGGTANLGGTLNVLLGYTPVNGDQIIIINAATISGTFAAENLPDANWSVAYNSPSTGQVSLNYVNPTQTAGFDGPGGVSEADGGSELQLWVKADEGTSTSVDDAIVFTWIDQSGYGRNMTAVNTPSFQSNIMNGLPVVQFVAGESDYFEALGFTDNFTSTGFTVFSVNQMTGTGDQGFIGFKSQAGLGSNQGVTFFVDDLNGNANEMRVSSPSTGSLGNNQWSANNRVPRLLSFTRSTSVLNAYDGGTNVVSDVNEGAIFNGTDPWMIGRYNNTNLKHFTGDVAEFILFEGVLNDASRTIVENYLSAKYDIAVSNDLYAGDTAPNGDYDFDVAGIGIEPSGSDPTASSESLSIANGGFLLDDGDYIFAGHNNTPHALVQTDLPGGGYTNRWARDWYLDIADAGANNGQITLTFDYAEAGLTIPSSNFALITRAAGSGPYSVAATNAVVSGNKVSFTVDVASLTDGHRYTIADDFVPASPGGISTSLSLWLKADQGVTGTTQVSQWDDQAGGLRHGTQGIATNQPALADVAINYNPAISFDGTDDFFTSALDISPATTLDLTTIIVFNSNQDANNPYRKLFGHDDGSFHRTIGLDDRSGNNFNYFAGGNGVGGYFDLVSNTDYISTTEYTSTTFSGVINGNPIVGPNGAPISGGLTNLTIGAISPTGSEPWDGQIAEVIMYSSTLSVPERQRIETYLAIKYGISIDQTVATNYVASDDGTVWDGTANVTYNNHITGIGRDDASQLNQKQSIDSDDRLTIGLGTIETSNEANANAFTNDLAYLVWGDNGLDMAFPARDIANVPASVDSRIQRVWRASEANGDVGSVTLRFDVNGEGFPGTYNPANFELLLDTDADFSAGATIVTASSYIGGIVEFNGVDIADGQLFTLGMHEPPLPPSNFIVYNSSSTEITFEWTDNATNETGYQILEADDYAISAGINVVANLGVDAITYTHTPTAPKYYIVYPTNGFEDPSSQSPVEFATNAAFPGQALSFDGTGQYVSVADNDNLSFGDGITDSPMSAEAWIFLDQITSRSIVSKRSGENEWHLVISSDGRVSVTLADQSSSGFLFGESPVVGFNTGEWYHIAFTYDGSSTAAGINTYVNGVLQAQNPSSSGPYTAMENTNSPLEIGTINSGASFNFDGQIDELKIWDFVKINFDDRFGSIQGDELNLVAYYPFDEGVDLTTIDRSINLNDGILNGAVFGPSSIPSPDVVTNTNDTGAGSLRDAITYANANPGTTITFNIGEAAPWIIQPASALPLLNGVGTIIDGTTQPGFSFGDANAMVQIDGTSSGAPDGLNAQVNNIEIYGLHITDFSNGGISSSGNVDGVIIGSSGAGNVLSGNTFGIVISGDWTVDSNRIGTTPDGSTANPNSSHGVRQGGGTSIITNNLISGNGQDGIHLVNSTGGSNHIISNNLIGTDFTGSSALANTSGIVTNNHSGVQILDNVISGNSGAAIFSSQNSSGYEINRNKIGTDATGVSPVPNNSGISFSSNLSNTRIGYRDNGNIIAFNTTNSINVNNGNDNTWADNSIFGNGNPITLGASANGSIAAPTIGNVSASEVSGTGVEGAKIHLYLGDGTGQGQTLLDSTVVSGGTWTINGLSLLVNDELVATVTDESGGFGSSEFSPASTVPVQNSLAFDGTDDHGSIGSNVFGGPYTGPFTVEAWVNSSLIGNNSAALGSGIFKNMESGSGAIGDLALTINHLGQIGLMNWREAGVDADGVSISDASISPATWTHVAASWDGSVNRIFINGVEQTFTTAGTSTGWGAGFEIGRVNPAVQWHYDGEMDELRIWNVARNSTEITNNLFNELDPGSEVNLVAYYKFNQSTGTSIPDAKGSNNATWDGTGGTNTTPAWAASSALTVPASIVSNTNDTGAGSLREAINYANANPGTTLTFDIQSVAPWEINLGSALPQITAANTIIDGSTQSGWTFGDPNAMVQINGSGIGGNANGINIDATNAEVYGLIITGFSGNSTNGNIYLATNAADYAIIGSDTKGNIIHGTGGNGIYVVNGDSAIIRGNRIGTLDGTTASAIGDHGIATTGEIDYLIVGGDFFTGEGNTITSSGASRFGMNLNGSGGGNGLSDVTITGNRIGTNINADGALPNGLGGINFIGVVSGVTVGGASPSDLNIISGNSNRGIRIQGGNTFDINGNYIGIQSDGSSALGNNGAGIEIAEIATNINIGDQSQNIISENTGSGILFNGNNSQNVALGNNVFSCNTAGGIGYGSGPLTPGATIDAMSLSSATVSAAAADGSTINVYFADDGCNNDQALAFAGTGLVSGGQATISGGFASGSNYVALVEDVNGYSEFSAPFLFTIPYPVAEGAGEALTFDGSNDFVDLGAKIGEGRTAITLEAWINPASITPGGVTDTDIRSILSEGSLEAGNTAVYLGFAGDNSETQLYAVLDAGAGLQLATYPASNITLNDWSHIAMTWNSGDPIRLYVNGTEVAQSPVVSGSIISATNDFAIGRSYNTGEDYFDGEIDEVKVWDFAMPESSIREYLTQKVTNSHPSFGNLLAYYRMDDSSDALNLQDFNGLQNATIDGAVYSISGAHLGDASTYEYTYPVGSGRNLDHFRVDNLAFANLPLHIYRIDQTPANNIVSGFDNIDRPAYYGVFTPGQTYDVRDSVGNLTSDRRILFRANGTDPTWTSISGPIGMDTDENELFAYGQGGSGQFTTAIDQNPYPTPADAGFSMSFDGNDDVNILGIDLQGGPFTIETWFKTAQASPYLMVVNENGSLTNTHALLNLNAGQVRFNFREPPSGSAGTSLLSPETYDDDKWHHAAGVYDGVNTITLYVDGVQVDQNSSVGSTSGYNVDVSLGKNFPNAVSQLTGELDEVRIWNIALGETNIRDNMIGKLDSNSDNLNNLVAYYRFDENSGTTAANLAGDGNGTVTGAIPVVSGAPQGEGSLYSYAGTPGILNTAQFGEDINIHFEDATGGIHGYLVAGDPNQLQANGFNNLDQGKYFGVFAPGGQKVEIRMDYNNGGSYDPDRRIVYRSDATDNAALGGWERLSGLINSDVASDSIFAFNVSQGEFSTATLNPPSSYPVLGDTDPGSALNFDGLDDQIQIVNQEHLNFIQNTGIYTIEAWVKLDNLANNLAIIGNTETTDENGFFMYYWGANDGSIRMSLTRSITNNPVYAVNTDPNIIADNDWHHVAIVGSGASAQFYIDGVAVNTNFINAFGAFATGPSTNSELQLGSIASNLFLNGELDEVRVWNASVSAGDILAFANTTDIASHPNYTDMIAYYKFDEGSGSILEDVFANNDGSWNGPSGANITPNWVASGALADAPQQNALNFDGDDYIDFVRQSFTSGLTYEAWINTTSIANTTAYNGNPALTIIGDNDNAIEGAFGVHDGKVRYTHWTGSGVIFDQIDGTVDVNDGQWHHVAVTHKSGDNEVRIYVDGVLDVVATSTIYSTGISANRVGSSYLSGGGNDNFFIGDIDEARIWNVALPEDEIRSFLYEDDLTASTNVGNLVLHYNFNQGDAGGANSGESAAFDQSSSTLDGALFGFGLTGPTSNFVTSGNTSFTPSVPATQSSNISVFNVTEFTADITWTSGEGARTVVLMHFGTSNPFPSPPNNTFGTADQYGLGTDLDNGWFVVYNGYGNNVSVENLSGGTDYEIAVLSVNGPPTFDTYNINTEVNNPIGFSTLDPISNFALDFDGTNDFVQLPNIPLNPNTDNFTVELWAKADAFTGTNNLIVQEDGTGTGRAYLFFSGQNLASNQGANTTGTTTLLSDTWYHLAVTFDGSDIRTYIDGVLEVQAPRVPEGTNGAFRLGISKNTDFPFDGQIDEVRIWDFAKDDAQIAAQKDEQLFGNEAGLLAYFQLDEGTGNTSVTDLVGGPDGTLINMDESTDWVAGPTLNPPNPASTFFEDFTDEPLPGTASSGPFIFDSGLWDGEGVLESGDIDARGGSGNAARIEPLGGNYIQTPPLDQATIFGFWYKGAGTGGTYDVMASDDGGATYGINMGSINPDPTYQEFTLDFTSNFDPSYTGSVRIVYNSGANALFIDDISADVDVLNGTVSLMTEPIADATFNAGDTDVMIYKLSATFSVADSNIEGLFLTPSGADSLDFELNGFDFYQNRVSDDFGSATLLGTSSWSPGDPIPRNSIGLLFNDTYTPGETVYFYVTADIRSSANAVTFNIDQPIEDNFGFGDANKIDGGLTPGANITISGSSPFPGNALQFDGSDDEVQFSAPIQQNWADFTIEMWVNVPSGTASQVDFFKQEDTMGGGQPQVILASILNGSPYFFLRETNSGTNDFVQGLTTIDDDTWHHLAYVKSGTEISVYIDGVLEGSVSGMVGDINFPGVNVNAVLEGNSALDEIKFWSFAKTDFSDRLNPLVGNEANLIAYYPMDEGVGTLVGDASLGINDGMMTNFNFIAGSDWITSGPFPAIADVTPPTIVSFVPSINTIVDADTQLDIAIEFDEAMDTGIDPTISFPIEDPSNTLTFSGSSWTDAFNFTASYSLTDANEVLTNIDVQVTDAQDVTGNQMDIYDAFDAFSIDTENPTITVDTYGTSITSPQLTGTIDDATATIDIEVDGANYAATNNGDGTWTLTAGAIASLADATYDVIATATDVLGNTGTDASTDELVISQTILTLPAENVASTSFTARWTEGFDAQAYQVDVSTEADFSSFVGAFQGLQTTETFVEVPNLDFSTEYFYRVRLVNSASEVSPNSNTTMAKTIVDAETLADSTALLQIYTNLNLQGLNWETARLREWTGVDLDVPTRTRVDIVDISGTSGAGDMPNSFTGDAAGGLSNITEMNASGNQITGLMDFVGTTIANLNVSDNSLQFDDLEPIVGIATVDYSNQSSVQYNEFTGAPIEVRYTTDYSLSTAIGGSSNVYTWYRNDEPISTGDDFIVNNAISVILAIDYDNMGTIRTEVTNALVPGLVINVDPQDVLAIANMEVLVTDANGDPLAASLDGFMLETTRTSTGFRVLETMENVNASTFTFPDVVLGDYIILVESDIELYIPTYFGNVFEWTEADTLFFRSDDVIEMTMVEVPRELTAADGEGSLAVLIEEDFEDDGSRAEARRRASKRKCGLRRKRSGGRTGQDDDEFELIAYGETDDNGEFQFGFLPQGTYRFFVEYPGIPLDASSFVEFEVGEAGVSDTDFSLQAFATEDGVEVTIEAILGVILEYFKDLEIYPNPSSEYLNIRYRHLKSRDVTAQLVDLTGSTKWSEELREGFDGELRIDVTNFEEGVYILRFYDRESPKDNLVSFRVIVKD